MGVIQKYTYLGNEIVYAKLINVDSRLKDIKMSDDYHYSLSCFKFC